MSQRCHIGKWLREQNEYTLWRKRLKKAGFEHKAQETDKQTF